MSDLRYLHYGGSQSQDELHVGWVLLRSTQPHPNLPPR
jgi:hypothetical protein